jgi:hypothetical protein
MNVAFVIIFCPNFVRIAEDENECNTRNCLLYKETIMKKRQRKIRANVYLLAIDAQVIFWSKVFAIPLQQRLF